MSARLPVSVRGALTTPTLSIFIVVVIAVLSYLGVAAPALLADGRTATVQRAVDSTPALVRWPSATMPGLPAFGGSADAGGGVWGAALTALESSRREQPEPLRGMLATPRLTVAVDAVATVDTDKRRTAPVPKNKVALVSDPGLVARSELVEGRLPDLTDPLGGIEIALTDTVAEQLEWKVGAVRRWDDLEVTLTGIVTPSGRDDGDWVFIGGSVDPLIERTADGDRILVVSAFMHVDEAAKLTDRVRDIKITSWMPFATDSVDAATAEQTAAQLRLLAADPVAIPMYDDTFYSRGLPFRSALPQALDAGMVRADAMTPVVAVAVVGPIVVALVVLGLVSRLISVRRVGPVRVLRARGASTGRLIALLGVEGAVLGLLGAVIGAGAAALRPGWTGAWTVLVPMVLAAVPVIALPRSTLADIGRSGRRDLGAADRSGIVRLGGELLILVLTAVLAGLILARGSAEGADPLLLALLVLLGACGSILALRLLPVLLTIAENDGRRRPSLTGLLGPARARRDTVVRAAPVFAVVVGLGVAVFAVAFAATVSSGIVRSAESEVGADVRIAGTYITADGASRVDALDGVAATAGVNGGSSVEASTKSRTAQTRVYALDRDAFVAVQRDREAAIPLPAALTEPAGDAVPVVISEKLQGLLALDDPAGAEFEVSGTRVRVVGVAASEVPFGTAEQWVIVDDANAADLDQRTSGVTQLYLATDPGADPEQVGAAAVGTIGEQAAFETPAQVGAARAADPGYVVVQGSLLAASAVVAVLLAVAVIAMLLLGAPTRARMLAILRTLGTRRRGAGGLVAWEVAPALLLAVPFGVGAGVAMAWLVIPQLDLRGFVGGSVQPPVQLGGAWLVLAVAGYVVLAAVAVVVATALASRIGAAAVIRADDEQD
ncbi:ABC transporter permease [Microbacterium sp. KUDC0406]|uniref:ABC transporter permease n=1 Tax=Microbacterium sp. KUDC0406 TaxID=2909588 RepID=UPI001F239500|nr:ABC transporter permease [Microbacterium sp. KUDC0406]UJP10863.1 ABC transporter permease [Microbacterium sp. KUDC0406]